MNLEDEIRRAVTALWESHRTETEAIQLPVGSVARTAVLTDALVPLLRLMHDIRNRTQNQEQIVPDEKTLRRAGLMAMPGGKK